MRVIPGVQDDFAGLIQAFVEITQIMSNAHDILVRFCNLSQLPSPPLTLRLDLPCSSTQVEIAR